MVNRVLVMAPHADDEIIGVGGALLRHIDMGDEVFVCIVTAPDEELFPKGLKEQIRREALNVHAFLGVKESFFLELPAVKMDVMPKHVINRRIGDIIGQVQPTIVYLPHRGDMHFDHQEIFDAAMVTLRPIHNTSTHTILVYETLSETEWNTPTVNNAFLPNYFINVSPWIERKIQAFEMYASQNIAFPHPRSSRAIRALSEVRGSTIGVMSAEAFMMVRCIQM